MVNEECVAPLAQFKCLNNVNMTGSPYAEEKADSLKGELLVILGTVLNMLKVNEEEVTKDDIEAANDERKAREVARKEAEEDARKAEEERLAAIAEAAAAELEAAEAAAAEAAAKGDDE
jgi:hypothetical protein